MDQQITERVSTLETDVAVIQSNYVRRDEFSALREEVGVGFAKTDARIDIVRNELNSKIDLMHAEFNAKIDLLHTELNGKMDAGFTRLDGKMDVGLTRLDGKIDQVREELGGKIDRAIATMLRWTFGLQLTIVALAIAAIKYL
ncbi:hypothetical protein GJ697_09450 [Pseudoduganella sp. FT25W]|uniref:DUF1640 domain-containing protein n=1 Tax=Duganella alba TaxID=2666081 RepID=A0A6L5QE96_9BURK|nr:hypothetical protein [Duganella alba]MRX08056.1 hypothetical protein [Duganella alba]MRX16407.1 hypothetical protein [Duganella alba]